MGKVKKSCIFLLALFAAILLCLGITLGMPKLVSAEETSGATESPNEASVTVGSKVTNHTTLAEAVSAAMSAETDGATVTLLKGVNENISIPEGKTLTLNLNGQSITGSGASTAVITNRGTLEIQGTGTVTRTDNYYVIVNEGTLTLNNGITVTKEVEGSSLIVNGQDGTPTIDKALLTVNGGTFVGGMNNIKNTNKGELIINDGKFTIPEGDGQQYANIFNWASTTIKGGTFENKARATKTDTGYILTANIFSIKSDETTDGAALTISGTPVFTSGNAEGEYAIVTREYAVYADSSDVTISGGSFTAPQASYISDTKSVSPTVKISGENTSFTGTRAAGLYIIKAGTVEVENGDFNGVNYAFNVSAATKTTVHAGRFSSADKGATITSDTIEIFGGTYITTKVSGTAYPIMVKGNGTISNIIAEGNTANKSDKGLFIDGYSNFTLSNNTITSYYAIYLGGNTLHPSHTVIESGTYNGKLYDNNKKAEIKGGTFSVLPPIARLSEGYEFIQNEDVMYVALTAEEANKVALVAEVVGVRCMTLQGAVAAATKNSTITLLTNVAENIAVAGGKTFTLNLNGFELTNAANKVQPALCVVTLAATEDQSQPTITNAGSLTVTGGTVSGAEGQPAILNSGTLAVTEGATVNSAESQPAIVNSGTTNISGGKINGALEKTGDTATYNITGGTFSEAPDSTYLGADIEFAQDQNGEYVALLQDQVAAMIGDTKYISLQVAVANANPYDTIVLQADIALTAEVVIDRSLTLDLNGHTIYVDGFKTVVDGKNHYTGYNIKVNGAGVEVTIINGNFKPVSGSEFTPVADGAARKTIEVIEAQNFVANNITVNCSGNYGIQLSAGCKSAEFTNVTFTNGSYCVIDYAGGDTRYTECTFETIGGYGIFQDKAGYTTNVENCKFSGDGARGVAVYHGNVIVSNSTFELGGNGSIGVAGNGTCQDTRFELINNTISATVGVYHPQEGELIISGGKINADCGVEMRAGNLTVKDNAEIAVREGVEYSVASNGNGSTVKGAAIAVSQHTTNKPINVTVESGTMSGPKALVQVDTVADSALEGKPRTPVDLAINGGTFIGAVETGLVAAGVSIAEPREVKNFICGKATFSELPNYTYFAEGFTAKQNTEGKYVTEEGSFAAVIGTTGYETLAAAVAAAKTDDVIILQSDIILTVEVDFTKSLTLDFNGHTITHAGDALVICNANAEVVFTDHSEEKSGRIVQTRTFGRMTSIWVYAAKSVTVENIAINSGDWGVYIDPANKGSVAINNVTIENSSNGLLIFSTGVVTVENSTIIGVSAAILGNGTHHDTDITLTNCNLECTNGTAFYHPQDGVLTIHGGTITGAACGVEMRAGSLTVDGGAKIIATNEEFIAESNGSGATVMGAAVAISQHSTDKPINVTINDATLTGVMAMAQVDVPGKEEAITIEINGGTFNGGLTTQREELTGFIKGGTFSECPDVKYVNEAYEFGQNANGSFGAYTHEEAAAKFAVTTGELAFNSLQAALDTAKAGEELTITLNADVNENVSIAANRVVVLNLNGHTLTNTMDMPTITNKGTLTVKGGTVLNENALPAILNQGTLTVAADETNVTSVISMGTNAAAVASYRGTVNITGGEFTGGLAFMSEGVTYNIAGGVYTVSSLADLNLGKLTFPQNYVAYVETAATFAMRAGETVVRVDAVANLTGDAANIKIVGGSDVDDLTAQGFTIDETCALVKSGDRYHVVDLATYAETKVAEALDYAEQKDVALKSTHTKAIREATTTADVDTATQAAKDYVDKQIEAAVAQAKLEASEYVMLYAAAKNVEYTDAIDELINKDEIKTLADVVAAKAAAIKAVNKAYADAEKAKADLETAKKTAIQAILDAAKAVAGNDGTDGNPVVEAQAEVVVPTATLAAINAATDSTQVTAFKDNALKEIADIRAFRKQIDELSKNGTDVLDAIKAFQEALLGDGSATNVGKLATVQTELEAKIKEVKDKVDTLATSAELTTAKTELNTAITNAKDALDTAISGVKTEVTALATTLGTIGADVSAIKTKVNSLENADIDSVITKLSEVQTALNTAINDTKTLLNGKLDTLTTNLGTLSGKLETVNSGLAGKIEALTTKVTALGTVSTNDLQKELDGVWESIKVIADKLQVAIGVEEEKDKATQSIDQILNELLGTVAAKVNAVRPLAAAAQAPASKMTAEQREKLYAMFSPEMAALIEQYYNEAITAVENATTVSEAQAAADHFKRNVDTAKMIDAIPAPEGVSLGGVYGLLAAVIVLTAVVLVLVIVSLRKKAQAAGPAPDGDPKDRYVHTVAPEETVVSEEPAEEPEETVEPEEPAEEPEETVEPEEPAKEPEETVEPEEPVEEPAVTVEPEEVPVEVPVLPEEEAITEDGDGKGDVPPEAPVMAAESEAFAFRKKPYKTFEMRLREASDEVLGAYSEIKNELCGYKKVRSRICKKSENFHAGRKSVAKIKIMGKSLRLYLALNPADYDEKKYHHVDKSDTKSYALVPLMVKVKGVRSIKRANRLIADCLQDTTKKDDYVQVDFAEQVRQEAAAAVS